MKTNGDILREHGKRLGIPPRTIEQVKTAMADAEEFACAPNMARLMLRHGSMTDEARAWLSQEYPQ